MTGIEHYKRAEQLTQMLGTMDTRIDPEFAQMSATLALAHATLALASRNFASECEMFRPEAPSAQTIKGNEYFPKPLQIINNAGSVEGWLDE